jgi:1,4-alpha-glucan branching enzyme
LANALSSQRLKPSGQAPAILFHLSLASGNNPQSAMSGYLTLILHAHLPFVRHPEYEHFLEEEWLFEAITETYIPLLQMMQRLLRDDVPFKLTLSVTPPLAAMLRDELLRDRYVQHLELLLELSRREIERNRDDPALLRLAEFYLQLFSESRRLFVDEWKCDLLAGFRQVRDAGALEIIASAATHGLLPLIYQQSEAAARAQVLIGRDEYVEAFHGEPSGFWLPECAYIPGLECLLQNANVRWFILDGHGLMHASPRPQRAVYAPCYTPDGPAAFARDRDSSRQVWSAESGYPGDPTYREFYRDIGFDLPMDHLGPLARGIRKFAGVKYHRITGRGPAKELYDPEAAKKTANGHATHFLEARRRQIRELGALDFDPIIVVPFDAELFGHWWFEGPHFLELFIRKAAFGQNDLELTTPSDFLRTHPTQQTLQPAPSSWGEKGHLQVWLDPSNSWIYPHLHAASQRMSELARAQAEEKPQGREDRVLRQLARELLLAQGSDWAFLMKTDTAKAYATKRTADHLLRFNRLGEQLVTGKLDNQFLEECERRHNLFPHANWRYYI